MALATSVATVDDMVPDLLFTSTRAITTDGAPTGVAVDRTNGGRACGLVYLALD